jgi:hypothetical protein
MRGHRSSTLLPPSLTHLCPLFLAVGFRGLDGVFDVLAVPAASADTAARVSSGEWRLGQRKEEEE